MTNKLKLVFGCDLRTLALFRIALALLIVADLISRSRDLTAHYSDKGILPRADLLTLPGGWHASLHLVSGSVTIQALLFVLSGVVALSLAVGYRTRLATILSWLLLTSLHWRNPMLLQGGDILLRLLLFWGMFLPLGARFSVDAALDDEVHKQPDTYFSLATVALLVQCMSVYFFSALLKSDRVWLPDATAVSYALHIDYITTDLGVWLRPFTTMHSALTYYVWYLELIGPILIFAPLMFPWMRLALQAMFITMHIGFLLCLKIGLFPFVSIASLLAFTPGSVWDHLGARIRTAQRLGVKIYYDRDCGFCLKTCRLLRTFLLFPETPIAPAQDYPDVYALMKAHNSWVVQDYDGGRYVRWPALALLFRRSFLFTWLGAAMASRPLLRVGDRFYECVAQNRARLGNLTAVLLPWRIRQLRPTLAAEVAVAFLALVVLWGNLATLRHFPYRLPTTLRQVQTTLSLNQRWNMFAPSPSKYDGWHVVRGVTFGGNVVDVLKGAEGEPDWSRPVHLADQFPNYRWRKYLMRTAFPPDTVHQPHYAAYLCRRWNQAHIAEHQLAKIVIYFNEERTTLDDAPRPVKRIRLHEGACPSDRTREPARDAGVEDPM